MPGYPSGSGLAYFNGRIYIMGDDAPFILVTDSLLDEIDSIRIFETSEHRIAKEKKPDTEAIAIFKKNNATSLLVVGSGSLTPSRDSCYVVGLPDKEIKRYSLDSFYTTLKNWRFRELNIEGATAIPAGILLVNRGNKSFPKNHLIVVPNTFWEQQATTKIRLIKAGANVDTSTFNGISGLDYSFRSDQLFLTVSTENTYNSYEDGAIGKSYLWIINDFASKKRLRTMNPDRIIDLEDTDSRFRGHKIESVCIISENNHEKVLILTADDDKGGTVLFRLIIPVTQ
ncbi:MAG TPA: hypothetical protein VFD56_14970 [Chitinophagaceae bacterium]|nr:hypothetical protein [Chitinophagaceae bacterium]